MMTHLLTVLFAAVAVVLNLGEVLGDTILGDAALGACLTGVFLVGVFLVGVFLVGVFLPTPPLGATAFALGVVAARVDLPAVSSRTHHVIPCENPAQLSHILAAAFFAHVCCFKGASHHHQCL